MKTIFSSSLKNHSKIPGLIVLCFCFYSIDAVAQHDRSGGRERIGNQGSSEARQSIHREPSMHQPNVQVARPPQAAINQNRTLQNQPAINNRNNQVQPVRDYSNRANVNRFPSPNRTQDNTNRVNTDRNTTRINDNNRPGNNFNRPGNNNSRPGNGVYNRPGYNNNRPGDAFNRPGNNYNYGNRGYNNNYRRPSYNAYNPNWRYSYAPRRNSIFNTLPSSYFSINFGGFGYRYYDGIYYRPYNNSFRVVAPPIGIFINTLPFGYSRIYVHDYPYYYYNGTYYDYQHNNYTVVSPPVGAVVESIPDGFETLVVDGETYYVVDGAQYKPVVQDNGEIWYEVIKANS